MDVANLIIMSRRRFITANMCFISTCLASFTAVSAQNERQTDTVKWRRLPDVEVVVQPRMSVTRQAAPLQILDRAAINRLGLWELSEVVRRFSGVTVKDYGGIGGLKTVSVRSLGAHHTAVVYDGVAVSDAQSGQVDISRFTLDNVDMIALSTGGQTDNLLQTARIHASAGALHITTREPRFSAGKPYLLSAKIKNGSSGLVHPVLSYGRKVHDRLSASVYADCMRADGKYPYTLTNGTLKTHEMRINSDIKTLRMEGNLYGDFGQQGTVETKLYTFHSERGLPGSVNFYNKTATERLWNDNSFAQARYKKPCGERLALQAVAKYAYAWSRYRDVNDKYAAGYQEDRNTQHEYYASAGILYTPSNGLSASLATDYAHTTLRNNFLNAPQPRRNTSLAAFAVQYKSDRFTASGSALGTYISDRVASGERPADRRHLSPAIAFSWRPSGSGALRIRASYKDIFRVPTFADLYYLRMGNTGLQPEKAKQYNAGLTWSGNIGPTVRYLSLSADGYYNRVEDKIVALPTLYIWRMMNMGEVEIKGADVNLSAEIPLCGKINTIISGNYTYQHAIDVTNPDAKNYRHQIPYTPRHSGSGSVTLEMPWVNVSWLLTAVGERYALPQNTKANRVEAYSEQSVSLNRTFRFGNASLRLQGEALNLADTQYDVIQYYPMPGRSWRLSVTLNI